MKPERWQQVKAVVTRALEVSPADRNRTLDEVCNGDNELRAEAASLLDAYRDTDVESTGADDSLRKAVLVEARNFNEARVSGDVDALRSALQTNLSASYDILATLGVGGMGAVFLARERALDRYVAIKTLRTDHAMTAGSRDRFRREARIAAQLSHPGILQLHAFGEVSGMWYLVMGYVRGPTLAQRIQSDGRLPPDEAWRILRALADALDHAHHRQVIHRDIKPANILLDAESSRPLLADFGISKLVSDTDTYTRAGEVLGTPHFMSPEQMSNTAECDARSDLYSLGAVGYAMLTGRAPFADTPQATLLNSGATSRIVPLNDVLPSISPELATVVMRCLATKPDDRWQSAGALRDALDRVDQTVDGGLPPVLREVAGFGAYALAWMCFWIAVLASVNSDRQRVLLALVALLVPFGLALHVARSLSPTVRLKQLVQVALWPPMWWGMWWPAGLRRPGDAWKRLPWPARGVRVALSALTVALPVLALGGNGLGLVSPTGNANTSWYIAVGMLVVLPVLSLSLALLWTRQHGLSRGNALHFLIGSTASSGFWQRPDIVRILSMQANGVRPPDSHVPADFVRAMEDLQRSGARDDAGVIAQAAALARQFVSAIAVLQREIAGHEREAPREESTRLALKLQSLEERPAAERIGLHEALMAIVQHELELLRTIQQQKILSEQRLAAMQDVLRALWTELLTFSNAVGAGPDSAARIVELIREGSTLLNVES